MLTVGLFETVNLIHFEPNCSAQGRNLPMGGKPGVFICRCQVSLSAGVYCLYLQVSLSGWCLYLQVSLCLYLQVSLSAGVFILQVSLSAGVFIWLVSLSAGVFILEGSLSCKCLYLAGVFICRCLYLHVSLSAGVFICRCLYLAGVFICRCLYLAGIFILHVSLSACVFICRRLYLHVSLSACVFICRCLFLQVSLSCMCLYLAGKDHPMTESAGESSQSMAAPPDILVSDHWPGIISSSLAKRSWRYMLFRDVAYKWGNAQRKPGFVGVNASVGWPEFENEKPGHFYRKINYILSLKTY